MKENIHFYYTNDLHSYFDHWPQVVTFLKGKRLESIRLGESSWTVDVGDHMDRVHPITEGTMGGSNVRLLNQAGYDFATLGNNEGITLSHQTLYHLYDQAEFNVICSNLTCTTEKNPDWLHTSAVVESNHGIKIGFIGLTAKFNPYYHLLGWHVEDKEGILEQEIRHLKEKTDVILLLSHLGINEDQRIAEAFPEIDVIIGGHTHHLLRTGQVVNQTLLTAAGKHCGFVGEVTLTWNHATNQLESKEAHTTEITHLPKDQETVQHLFHLQTEADEKLKHVIIDTKNRIDVDWYRETPIMKALTEKVRAWTNAEIAMLNAGLLVSDFPIGVITYKDVHAVCPHPINPCVVTLTGEELTEVVRASLTQEFMDIKLKGFGFRGKVLGRMVFAGLDIEFAHHKQAQQYVKAIYYQNKALENDREYTVAVPDMFTFGRLLPPIARSLRKDLFLPEFIREILVDTLYEFQA
jgi:2',3'-cyclic-nucleotide 2'-phosphodiesterase (5'-nucleotidase family)